MRNVCSKCKQPRHKKSVTRVQLRGGGTHALGTRITIVACDCPGGVAPEYFDIIDELVRGRAGLLTGKQMRRLRRNTVGDQAALASLMGVEQSQISRWEKLHWVQGRCMDRFLRLIFASAEARNFLSEQINSNL